jgi:hypothetical protein
VVKFITIEIMGITELNSAIEDYLKDVFTQLEHPKFESQDEMDEWIWNVFLFQAVNNWEGDFDIADSVNFADLITESSATATIDSVLKVVSIVTSYFKDSYGSDSIPHLETQSDILRNYAYVYAHEEMDLWHLYYLTGLLSLFPHCAGCNDFCDELVGHKFQGGEYCDHCFGKLEKAYMDELNYVPDRNMFLDHPPKHKVTVVEKKCEKKMHEIVILPKKKTSSSDSVVAKIREEAQYVGIKPFSHNLVGLYLNELEKRHNFTKAQISELVVQCGLDSKGWEHLVIST